MLGRRRWESDDKGEKNNFHLIIFVDYYVKKLFNYLATNFNYES